MLNCAAVQLAQSEASRSHSAGRRSTPPRQKAGSIAVVKIRLPHRAVSETKYLLSAVSRFLDEVEPALRLARDEAMAEFEARIDRDAEISELGQWYSELEEIRREYDEGLLSTLTKTCMTLLYSTIETQLPVVLLAIAEKRDVRLKPREVHGSAVNSSSIFLSKVLDIGVTNGPDWQALRDIETLRTAIVHRNARLSPDDNMIVKLRSIDRRYGEGLDIVEMIGHFEVHASVGLARKLLIHVHSLFSALYAAGELNTEYQVDNVDL